MSAEIYIVYIITVSGLKRHWFRSQASFVLGNASKRLLVAKNTRTRGGIKGGGRCRLGRKEGQL